jgi:hypothetical protein
MKTPPILEKFRKLVVMVSDHGKSEFRVSVRAANYAVTARTKTGLTVRQCDDAWKITQNTYSRLPERDVCQVQSKMRTQSRVWLELWYPAEREDDAVKAIREHMDKLLADGVTQAQAMRLAWMNRDKQAQSNNDPTEIVERTVELREFSGNVRGEPAPVGEDFPAIITLTNGARAFYRVGTRNKGTVGLYHECDTAALL